MDKRGKAIIFALLISLVGAILSAIAKLVFGYSTRSLAFTADGLHSVFDAIATVLGVISIYMASQHPDEGHPYGHHKFETISAMLLSVILLFAGFEVGSSAIGRLVNETQQPSFSAWGLLIIFATVILNLAMSNYERRVAKRVGSSFLEADALHNQSDIWIAFGVLTTLACTYFGIRYVDSIVSIGISLYLGFLSVSLFQFNVKPLVDHSALDPDMVKNIVTTTDGVLHCHHIRSRGNQGQMFLDLNIHLPGTITLDRAHQITHSVEERLKNSIPGLVDVVIHTEPHNHPPCSKEG